MSNHDLDNGGITQKGSRELLGQLVNSHYTKEANQVIGEVGYDDGRVREKLTDMVTQSPEDYHYFLYALRKGIRQGEEEFTEDIDQFLKDHPATEAAVLRKTELSQRVLMIDEHTDQESLKQSVIEMFPSGNYLVHGTSVKGCLSIANDSEGLLKSIAEQGKTVDKAKGKGGLMGISFSFDGVRALPGTWRHMCMFVTSPEVALKGGDKKLVVPYYAADHELQLVGASYSLDIATHIDATLDFFGFKNLFLGSGVIHDIAEIEHPYNCEPGDSPIEKDVKLLKSGQLTEEKITSQYRVVDNMFIVDPSAMEGDISEGTIWLDYLIKNTDEGRAINKPLSEFTKQDISGLFEATKGHVRTIIRRAEQEADNIIDNSAVVIPIEDAILFVPKSDLNKWLDVFSRVNYAPKVIVPFSPAEGPRVPNWRLPEGDYDKAEKVVNRCLQSAGVPEPTLSFDQVLEKPLESDDMLGQSIKHVKWGVVSKSKEMVLVDGMLQLVTP